MACADTMPPQPLSRNGVKPVKLHTPVRLTEALLIRSKDAHSDIVIPRTTIAARLSRACRTGSRTYALSLNDKGKSMDGRGGWRAEQATFRYSKAWIAHFWLNVRRCLRDQRTCFGFEAKHIFASPSVATSMSPEAGVFPSVNFGRFAFIHSRIRFGERTAARGRF